MAKLTFELVRKPIEERIIDAACIYWDVERSYFFEKNFCRTAVYRKGVVYYLIKQNTTHSYEFIAKKFGFLSHQPVLRLVNGMEVTKNIYKQHLNDINQIQLIADKLDADTMTTEIKLVNNRLQTIIG